MTLAVFMKMRERVSLLIGIIGIAIVSFLLMDALNSSTNLSGNQQENVIGTVDGEKIDYQEFNNYYEYVKARISYFNGLWTDPSFSFSEDQLYQIRNNAWDEYVINQIVREQANELGMNVTQEEVDSRFYSPRPMREVRDFYMQIYPNAQTEGYNVQTLRQLVQQIQSFDMSNQQQQAVRQYYEVLKRHIGEQLLRSKFVNLFNKSIVVPEWEAQQAYRHTNQTFDISYLSLPYTSVKESEIQVADADLRNYLSENTSEFDQTTSVDLLYVIFNIEPTSADSAAALEFVNEKMDAIRKSGRDSLYVRQYSETPYNRGYFPKDEILTKMADTLFQVEPGTEIGPYLEDGKYRIVKLQDRRTLPDSVKLRTVFINAQNYANIDSARKVMDSVKIAFANGTPFDSLVANYSEDPQSAAQGGDLGWFKPSNNTLTWDIYSNAFFKHSQGDVFTSESQNGVNFMQITDQGEPTEMVKYYILDRTISPGEQTRNTVYAEASEFATVYANPDSFQAGIEAANLVPRQAKDVKPSQYKLPGINVSAREVIKWAFESEEPNEVKMFNVFEPTDDKYVIAQVTNSKKGDDPSVESLKPQLRAKVVQAKKAQILKDKLAGGMAGASSISQVASNLENTQVQSANGISFNAKFIQGVGNEPVLAGVGYALPLNVLSEPVEGTNGVYVVEKTNMQEITIPEDLGVQTNQLRSTLQNRFGNSLLQFMLDAANTTDMRYKYY